MLLLIFITSCVKTRAQLFKAIKSEDPQKSKIGFTDVRVGKRKMDKIRAILENNPTLINSVNDQGFTPLHVAAKRGYKNMTDLFILKGANLNAKDPHYGSTPLHIAVVEKRHDTVVTLIINGADVNVADKYGRTPLHYAAQAGNSKQIKLLIKKGAKVSPVDNKFGYTPLHEAVIANQLECAKLLIQNKADINARTKKGITPLHLAKYYRRKKITPVLLRAGANPYALDSYGRSPNDMLRQRVQEEAKKDRRDKPWKRKSSKK